MTTCTRFEDEGLLALERGESLDQHFNDCSECVEAQRVYGSLKDQLTALGETEHLADDWQQVVLESIAQSKQAAKPISEPVAVVVDETAKIGAVSTPMLRLAASFAAMAIAIVLLLQFDNAPDSSNQFAAVVIEGDTNYRGSNAKVGDSLQLRFNQSKAQYSELRVYLDSRIYFQCDLECIAEAEDPDLGKSVLMTAVGEYQGVLIQSDQPLDVPAESLDADILLARDTGMNVMLAEKVVVR